MSNWYVQQQVIYLPNHADSLTHPDVEYGFITSLDPDGKHAFCRFWLRDKPLTLRTKTNSERTPLRNLRPYHVHPTEYVMQIIQHIEKGEHGYG